MLAPQNLNLRSVPGAFSGGLWFRVWGRCNSWARHCKAHLAVGRRSVASD